MYSPNLLTSIDWNFLIQEPFPELTMHSWLVTALPIALLGLIVGCGIELWVQRLTPIAMERRRRARCIIALVTACIWGFYATVVIHGMSLDLEEVRPQRLWEAGRLFYHLTLISLLIAATITDLREYIIPDEIVIPGLVVGICGAGISGDWQIMHFWVDWGYAVPGLSGPYIPLWEQHHPHWHGLVWSITGTLLGAGITLLIRQLSQFVLQRESLGLGDVTLMAMVGSFLGWQAVIIAIMWAPLFAIVIGGLTRIIIGKSYIPYGPYLGFSSLIVLTFWRWIWQAEILAENPQAIPIVSIRRLFSDWVALLWLTLAAVAGFIILLGVLRLFQQLAIDKSKSADFPDDHETKAKASSPRSEKS